MLPDDWPRNVNRSYKIPAMSSQDFTCRFPALGFSAKRAPLARAAFAAIAVAAFVGGMAAAAAADLPLYPPGHFVAVGPPILPLVIYDYEPGIVVRAWWLPPWRHRHYFPATGRLPRIGRREDLSAVDSPEPAESFERTWSTSAAFVHERPRALPLPPLK
jgi:hypothetical protein